MLIDVLSINRSDPTLMPLTTAILFETPQREEKVTHILTRWQINCPGRMLRVVQVASPDFFGREIWSDAKDQWHFIEDGTIGELYRMMTCEKKETPELRLMGDGPLASIASDLFDD